MTRLRQSVPAEGVAAKYLTGQWRYVMPDFDRPGYSIIEATFEECSSRVQIPQTDAEPHDREHRA